MTKRELIDFSEWFNNRYKLNIEIDLSDIDEYFESSNYQAPDKSQIISENEQSVKVCSHEFIPQEAWVHKCLKCGELHIEYKQTC